VIPTKVPLTFRVIEFAHALILRCHTVGNDARTQLVALFVRSHSETAGEQTVSLGTGGFVMGRFAHTFRIASVVALGASGIGASVFGLAQQAFSQTTSACSTSGTLNGAVCDISGVYNQAAGGNVVNAYFQGMGNASAGSSTISVRED
jgi:hypothetical protein